MPIKTKSVLTECPTCSEEIQVATPKVGDRVVCGGCQQRWEIIWLNPLELDWPYEELDDNDDYDDFEDLRKDPDF